MQPPSKTTTTCCSANLAAAHGARTLELNLDPSHGSRFFEESRTGLASELVPAWVDALL